MEGATWNFSYFYNAPIELLPWKDIELQTELYMQNIEHYFEHRMLFILIASSLTSADKMTHDFEEIGVA